MKCKLRIKSGKKTQHERLESFLFRSNVFKLKKKEKKKKKACTKSGGKISLQQGAK